MAEGITTFLVVFFFDGILIAGPEGGKIAEEAGDEEVEEGPEFGEVVFDRGAGEAEAVTGFKLAGGLGDFGVRVFDVLGFVENGELEVVLLEVFTIALQEREGGDDEVGVRDGGEGFASFGAGEGEDSKARRKFFDFSSPVGNDGGGANNQ